MDFITARKGGGSGEGLENAPASALRREGSPLIIPPRTGQRKGGFKIKIAAVLAFHEALISAKGAAAATAVFPALAVLQKGIEAIITARNSVTSTALKKGVEGFIKGGATF